MCSVNFSLFPGDKRSGSLGSSMLRSWPSFGMLSNSNFAVNQLSVRVVIVTVTGILTPRNKYITFNFFHIIIAKKKSITLKQIGRFALILVQRYTDRHMFRLDM